MAGCAVTKTLIDLDEPLFATAQAVLGTRTKKETVNAALAEAVHLTAIQEYLRTTGIYEREPSGLVLADASALVHGTEPAVAQRLLPLLVLGELATCAAVAHELATVADGASAPVLAALHRASLRWLPTQDADLTRASEIQAELTDLGQPALPWSRLVVAAVAGRHQATVLHHSSDFDLIAKVTGQAVEWVAVPGI
jgi:predicted nucleic acid-binding protein